MIDTKVIHGPLQPAAALIQAGRLTEAHRLLLKLTRKLIRDPNLWLMLAWTAPTRSAAREYFLISHKLDPQNELAGASIALIDQGLKITPALSSPANQPKSRLAEKIHPSIVSIAEASTKSGLTEISLPSYSNWIVAHISSVSREFLSLSDHHFRWIMVIYLILLASAELVTSYVNPLLGLSLHAFLMVILFFHASMSRVRAQSRFLFTVALAPLIRLLSLSMPLAGFQFTYWYVIIGFPLLLSAYVVFKLTAYKRKDVGLSSQWLPLQILIGVLGFPLGWLEYQILQPKPLVQSWQIQNVVVTSLILLIFTGFLEEFIFRGLMQRAADNIMRRSGPYWISILFAVLHIGYKSSLDFGFVLFVGLLFAFIVKRTNSIWGVTLAHGLTNISLFILVPLLMY